MSTWQIGLVIIAAIALIYGARKLIAHENHQNDNPDTERDNNTEQGIQEIKKTRKRAE